MRKITILWTTILSSKEGHGIVRKDGTLDVHCRWEEGYEKTAIF
jgi:hypothetical protein